MPTESREKTPSSASTIRRGALLRFSRLLMAGMLAWLFLRTFIVQGMYIPSNSMQKTLNPGDMVFVNKLVYGPRIPITPLSIPFTEKYLTWIQFPYIRLPGYGTVSRNDIIVFNLPVDKSKPIDCRELYIKRCVGLPGDSLTIASGIIIVNGSTIPFAPMVVNRYAVELSQLQNSDSVFTQAGVKVISSARDDIHFTVMMTEAEAEKLKSEGKVKSVVRLTNDSKYYDYKIFPQNTATQYRWNSDNFGPIIIPQAGKTVDISTNNIGIYKNAIVNFENNTLEIRRDSVYINGKAAHTYTFKMNYYFVAGDNRYDSYDSRYFGFVPEDHLIGKVNTE